MLDKNKNMTNFGRVLTTCIYDKKKENGSNDFCQIPIYTKVEYMKEFTNINKSGGLCEIFGLEEYQYKPYFENLIIW